MERPRSANAAHEPLESGLDEQESPEVVEVDEPVDEALVAAFGEWFLSQPAEWISEMDELGRKGPVASK